MKVSALLCKRNHKPPQEHVSVTVTTFPPTKIATPLPVIYCHSKAKRHECSIFFYSTQSVAITVARKKNDNSSTKCCKWTKQVPLALFSCQSHVLILLWFAWYTGHNVNHCLDIDDGSSNCWTLLLPVIQMVDSLCRDDSVHVSKKKSDSTASCAHVFLRFSQHALCVFVAARQRKELVKNLTRVSKKEGVCMIRGLPLSMDEKRHLRYPRNPCLYKQSNNKMTHMLSFGINVITAVDDRTGECWCVYLSVWQRDFKRVPLELYGRMCIRCN